MNSTTLRARVALAEIEAPGLTIEDLLAVAERDPAIRPTPPTLRDYVPVVAGLRAAAPDGHAAPIGVTDIRETRGSLRWSMASARGDTDTGRADRYGDNRCAGHRQYTVKQRIEIDRQGREHYRRRTPNA